MSLVEAKMDDGQPKNDRGASKFSLSRRQKLYWSSFIVSATLGLAMSWFMHSTGILGINSKHPFDFLSSKISKNIAVTGSIIYFISMITVCILYHKGMDEQEERAYLIANTASWYFLLAAVPIWWLLSRADIAPSIDGMAIAMASFIVNLAVWAWKKFL